MKILTSFISLFILFLQNELSEAIVGGTAASIAQYPFQVSLQRNSLHLCGGSIVHAKFVLTAAHCIAGLPMTEMRLVAGVANLNAILSDDNIRLIAQEYIHPLYNTPLLNNDIALVKVNKAWNFGTNIAKATLPPITSNVLVGQPVSVTGWGRTSPQGPGTTSSFLRQAVVQVFNRSECMKRYQGIGLLILLDNVFCTVGNTIRGVCKEDSGGPVTDNIIIPSFTPKGLIIGPYNTDECGNFVTPDIHLQVSKYRLWIDTTMLVNG